jgi:hypothetical protein
VLLLHHVGVITFENASIGVRILHTSNEHRKRRHGLYVTSTTITDLIFSVSRNMEFGMIKKVYYYDMILLQDDELKGEYKDSVVWRRDSKIFNWTGSYPITQIIDGQGQPVEPAYSQWVERSQTIMRIGDEPNKNVFFSLDDYDGVSSKVRDCDALRYASRNQTDGGSS